MEQKIEFLEIQLKEINDRETNLKNLNNSIMTAFNDINRDRDIPASVLSFLFVSLIGFRKSRKKSKFSMSNIQEKYMK